MGTLLNNIKGCYKHVPYTLKHYFAFLKTEKKLLGHYKYKYHDWDKLAMFIFFPILGEDFINELHRMSRHHHPTYTIDGLEYEKPADEIDWIEAIIDWECARLTKPDKPLNARETLYKFYPSYIKYCEPYLKKLGL